MNKILIDFGSDKFFFNNGPYIYIAFITELTYIEIILLTYFVIVHINITFPLIYNFSLSKLAHSLIQDM